jgi:hypothetical protein
MQLISTTEEKLTLLQACLDDGLPFFPAYGLELSYDDAQYEEARASAAARTGESEDEVCREDIWGDIVRNGGDLVFIDNEDGDAEVGRLNLSGMEHNWPRLMLEAPRSMADYISGNYDANSIDNIFQVLLFGSIKYG